MELHISCGCSSEFIGVISITTRDANRGDGRCARWNIAAIGNRIVPGVELDVDRGRISREDEPVVASATRVSNRAAGGGAIDEGIIVAPTVEDQVREAGTLSAKHIVSVPTDKPYTGQRRPRSRFIANVRPNIHHGIGPGPTNHIDKGDCISTIEQCVGICTTDHNNFLDVVAVVLQTIESVTTGELEKLNLIGIILESVATGAADHAKNLAGIAPVHKDVTAVSCIEGDRSEKVPVLVGRVISIPSMERYTICVRCIILECIIAGVAIEDE